jgi:AcrR family transcriptional regulator
MLKRSQVRPHSSQKQLNRPAVLRNVMRVLLVKGFADTSMTDLTKAASMNRRSLYKAFGTKEEIVGAAIRFCAESEACLAHEPLRMSHSGKEAISCMLEENVRLCGRWPRVRGCLFTLNAFIIPTQDPGLQEFLSEQRRSLQKPVRDRVAQSVVEGELPEDTNVDAVANLCLAVLGGLTFRVIDGTPKGLLLRSIELFVNGLGFSSQKSLVRRASKAQAD